MTENLQHRRKQKSRYNGEYREIRHGASSGNFVRRGLRLISKLFNKGDICTGSVEEILGNLGSTDHSISGVTTGGIDRLSITDTNVFGSHNIADSALPASHSYKGIWISRTTESIGLKLVCSVWKSSLLINPQFVDPGVMHPEEGVTRRNCARHMASGAAKYRVHRSMWSNFTAVREFRKTSRHDVIFDKRLSKEGTSSLGIVGTDERTSSNGSREDVLSKGSVYNVLPIA